jgi:hypothetical protein
VFPIRKEYWPIEDPARGEEPGFSGQNKFAASRFVLVIIDII